MSDKQKEREKLLKSFSNSNGKKFYLRDILSTKTSAFTSNQQNSVNVNNESRC